MEIEKCFISKLIFKFKLVVVDEESLIFLDIDVDDDFIFIEDLFLEKVELLIELFGKFELIKVEVVIVFEFVV